MNLSQAALSPRVDPAFQQLPHSDHERLAARLTSGAPDDEALQAAFRQFVGTTFFGQMLSSMRDTVGKPAYLHGGQAEEIFRQQLDQKIVDEVTVSSAPQIADPMYELFKPRGR